MTYGEQLGTSTTVQSGSKCLKKSIVIKFNLKIITSILKTAIKRLQDNKSPGKDLIVGHWYKNLTFYRNDLAELYNNTFTGLVEIPTWMAKAKTILLPKNDQTSWAKNYRPIALQNIMLKLYTGCINQFCKTMVNVAI